MLVLLFNALKSLNISEKINYKSFSFEDDLDEVLNFIFTIPLSITIYHVISKSLPLTVSYKLLLGVIPPC